MFREDTKATLEKNDPIREIITNETVAPDKESPIADFEEDKEVEVQAAQDDISMIREDAKATLEENTGPETQSFANAQSDPRWLSLAPMHKITGAWSDICL